MIMSAFWKPIIAWIQQLIKQWAKPATLSMVSGILSDLTRCRADLVFENAMLRQQLIVLNRQVKRPQITNRDRFRLILLAHCTSFWKQALHIVQPDTLLRWHRELFRFYWQQKSKNQHKKPKVSIETIQLIRQMAKENPLWGADSR